MRIEDACVHGRRTWIRPHEPSGKRREIPCRHKLDACLYAYLKVLVLVPMAMIRCLAKPMTNMSDSQDARIYGDSAGRRAPVAGRAVRLRVLLALGFTLTILALTVSFFGAMSLGLPIMSSVVLGRSITVANVAGVSIIGIFLMAVLIFEHLAGRFEKRSVE